MMDQEYHRRMYKLKRKVCAKEVVVGWFSTGTQIEPSSVVINSFYQSHADSTFAATQHLPSPIHVVVDTACTNERMSVKAFVSMPLAIDSLVHFHEIPVEVASPETEGGVAILANVFDRSQKGLTADVEAGGFEEGLRLLLEKFRKVHEYT